MSDQKCVEAHTCTPGTANSTNRRVPQTHTKPRITFLSHQTFVDETQPSDRSDTNSAHIDVR